MKIINPSVQVLEKTENPGKYIEQIARVCYKSEDKITEDSHKAFLKRICDSGHHAMLEHYRFIYGISAEYKDDVIERLSSCGYMKYFKITTGYVSRPVYIISFSVRSIIDLFNSDTSDGKRFAISLVKKVINDYKCEYLFPDYIIKMLGGYNYFMDDRIFDIDPSDRSIRDHYWHSVKFICDRGVSHEIVRHRDASFAQESTRYCSYNKDKYGNEITVIKPCFYDENSEKFKTWKETMETCEEAYFILTDDLKSTAQEARSVLPNSLKTEIIMTATTKEWLHFFKLRCDSHAHPQMQEVAKMAFKELSNIDLVIKDAYEEYTKNMVKENN